MNRQSLRRIGPYRVDGVLGSGGMGIVYSATHTSTHQRVAIKTVRARSVHHQRGIRREVHTLSRLNHPGVVSIVDHGNEDGSPWYAMVLLEGTTLKEAIGRSSGSATGSDPAAATLDPGSFQQTLEATLPAFDEATAADTSAPSVAPCSPAPDLQAGLVIARRLMATLAHVHALGLVHKDLKPANVFLVDGAHPVLVDFGLAHGGALGMGRETVQDQVQTAGTPAYVAPETIEGRPTDARTDMYSVGCVLFELFAGRPPFADASTPRLLTAHLKRPPPDLSDLNDEVPDAVVDLIHRMLEKDPRKRTVSAVDALEVFESLIGPDDEGYDADRDVLPIYRPQLAGRASTLDALRERIEAVSMGQGGFTVVAGPSGIGKTYLVNTAAWGLDGSVTVLPGRCSPFDAGLGDVGTAPLQALSEVFDHIADLCVGDPDAADALLGPRGALLAPFHPRLKALPALREWPAPAALEGAAQRRRLVRAVVDTLRDLAAREDVVILIDDLQWADGLTLAVLAELAATDLSQVPLHVVATCRHEDRPAEVDALLAQVRTLDLSTLDRDAVVEIIRDMLASDDPPPELVDRLVAHADGSPFFVSEYLRTAAAVGLLERRGALGLRVRGTAEDLPDSLGELITRRLDTLPAPVRRVAEVAAVLGRQFDEDLAAATLDLDEDTLAGLLHTLLRLQVMAPSPLGGLQLAHDKLRETIYAGLSAEARTALHRRVARAIAARHRGDDDLPHAALALHLELAGEPEAALPHYRAVAESAFDKLAYERAITTLEKVVDLGGEALPARDRGRYAQMLGESCWSLGDIPRCEQYTLQAFSDLGARLPRGPVGWVGRLVREAGVQGLHLLGVGLARESDPERREDLRRLAVACNTLCWRYLFDDNIPYILGLAMMAANQVERADPLIPLATAHGWLGYNAGALRLHRLAARYFARAHASAREADDLSGAVFTILMEGLYQAGAGRFHAVLDGSSRALKMLDGQGDPQNEELHHTMMGNCSFYLGRFDACEEHFAQVLDLATARRNAQHRAWGLYAACWALHARGRFDEARPRLEEARDLLAENADLPSEIIVFANLAWSRWIEGDAAGARADVLACAARIDRTKVANYPTAPAYGLAAEVAIELARAHPEDREIRRLAGRLVRASRALTLLLPYGGCIATRVRGLLDTLEGRSRAPRVLRRAAESADRIGMAFESAQCWWALARFHADAVPEAPAEARRRLQDLGCPWHLAQLTP